MLCTTSGSTGTPAILLHDRQALKVYNVLGYVRSLATAFLSMPILWALIRGRARLAAVFVTDGHFLGNTMMARRLRKAPWRAGMQRLFSALTPVADLVGTLNNFQPVVLGGYPSVLESLADEQQADRLCIHPVLISVGRRNPHRRGSPTYRRSVRLSGELHSELRPASSFSAAERISRYASPRQAPATNRRYGTDCEDTSAHT